MQIGQDGLFQSLYFRKWTKSAFEIVVMVEERQTQTSRMLENMCFKLYTVYVNKIVE